MKTASSIAAGAALIAAVGAGAYMLNSKNMKKAMRKSKFKKTAGKAVKVLSDFADDMSAIVK